MQNIVNNNDDPNEQLLYNPLNWRFTNNTPFPADFDWLQDPVRTVINGRPDAFSLRYLFDFDSPVLSRSLTACRRIGQECQPFSQTPPDQPLFDTKKVVIVSNGRYGPFVVAVRSIKTLLSSCYSYFDQMCEFLFSVLGESIIWSRYIPH